MAPRRAQVISGDWPEARMFVFGQIEQHGEDLDQVEAALTGMGQTLADVKRILDEAKGSQTSLPSALVVIKTKQESMEADLVLIKRFVLDEEERQGQRQEQMQQLAIERLRARNTLLIAMITAGAGIATVLLNLLGHKP